MIIKYFPEGRVIFLLYFLVSLFIMPYMIKALCIDEIHTFSLFNVIWEVYSQDDTTYKYIFFFCYLLHFNVHEIIDSLLVVNRIFTKNLGHLLVFLSWKHSSNLCEYLKWKRGNILFFPSSQVLFEHIIIYNNNNKQGTRALNQIFSINKIIWILW